MSNYFKRITLPVLPSFKSEKQQITFPVVETIRSDEQRKLDEAVKTINEIKRIRAGRVAVIVENRRKFAYQFCDFVMPDLSRADMLGVKFELTFADNRVNVHVFDINGKVHTYTQGITAWDDYNMSDILEQYRNKAKRQKKKVAA